jgi:transposase InsO family protein
MILATVTEAQDAGARLERACEIAGVAVRTLQRWHRDPEGEDQRSGPRRRPHNALTTAEEAQVVTVLTSKRYAGLSPKQLVPQLADEGLYLASESTMYRVQRRHGLRTKRRPLVRQHVARATGVHRASGSNQVWSWDITWLPTVVRGQFLHLYLMMDVWSRRIVGWTVETTESADVAAALFERTCRDGNVDPRGLVLHSDNGAAMRGSTMLATLQQLGVVASFSRPHVSDDNPYSEALFRTLKHTPAYPPRRFENLVSARLWVERFVGWYNGVHRHSAIRFVTPDERHFGREHIVLEQRCVLYERARHANPERWTRGVRIWSPVGEVVLNPEREVRAA